MVSPLQVSPTVEKAALALALDAAAGELVPALEARSVPSLLLRGPAIARWLYEDSARPYTDLDLLVRAADQARAAELLIELGFESVLAGLSAREVADLQAHDHVGTHATTWTRNGVVVDLHVTLNQAAAAPERVWAELWGTADRLEVAGRQLAVPGQAGVATLVALHAAAHGQGYTRTLRDLERAIDRFPDEVWRQAVSIAERLDALDALTAGLRLLPDGAALADRIGLPDVVDAETTLRARNAPPTAIGFARLARARGARAKAGLLAREIAPPPAFMRRRFRVARWGPPGLALSYVWRPLWLILHARSGYRAARDERRRAA